MQFQNCKTQRPLLTFQRPQHSLCSVLRKEKKGRGCFISEHIGWTSDPSHICLKLYPSRSFASVPWTRDNVEQLDDAWLGGLSYHPGPRQQNELIHRGCLWQQCTQLQSLFCLGCSQLCLQPSKWFIFILRAPVGLIWITICVLGWILNKKEVKDITKKPALSKKCIKPWLFFV